MSLTALLLILTAAFSHSTWNLVMKRSNAGIAFLWLIQVAGLAMYAPLMIVLVVLEMPVITTPMWVAISVSAVTHTVYILSLQHGYRHGDLSIVYPVARGTGPGLAVLGAVLIYGERPSVVAIVGAAMILIGVVGISRAGTNDEPEPGLRPGQSTHGVRWGLITGCCIATYSMIDSYAVAQLAIFPFLYFWLMDATRTVLFLPIVLWRKEDLRGEIRNRLRGILAVGFLYPLSYILVLFAMALSPLSYVAPAREVSVLIGAAMGTHLLSEGRSAQRLVSATLMMVGIIALALG